MLAITAMVLTPLAYISASSSNARQVSTFQCIVEEYIQLIDRYVDLSSTKFWEKHKLDLFPTCPICPKSRSGDSIAFEFKETHANVVGFARTVERNMRLNSQNFRYTKNEVHGSDYFFILKEDWYPTDECLDLRTALNRLAKIRPQISFSQLKAMAIRGMDNRASYIK